MAGAHPVRSSSPEKWERDVRLLGTGAAAPTVEIGEGVTATRNSAGNYRLSFSEPPGIWLGLTYGLQAATPADLAGHTVVADTFTAKSGSTNAYIDVVLYNSTFDAHDLAANEYICLTLKFKQTSVTG
jgi:hypothetical protein